MADPSPFLRPNEVEKISLLSDVTRWRHEKTGSFPRRIKITDRKIVYRKSEIDDWTRDPEGWRARNASQADRDGEKRTIYSLRHTYATFRLQEGVNHYVLARNMGTSVKMLENFYGHTSNRAMADELTKMKVKKPKVLPWE